MLSNWMVGSSQPIDVEKERGTGFSSKQGDNSVSHTRPNFSPIVSKNMQDPTGQYAWLFRGIR
jgi:hypothetical protein